jgi:hypothetical protein
MSWRPNRGKEGISFEAIAGNVKGARVLNGHTVFDSRDVGDVDAESGSMEAFCRSSVGQSAPTDLPLMSSQR